MANRVHAIVVGGSRGIGRVVGQRLAQEGYAVSSLSRSGPPGGALAAAGVQYRRADLLDGAALTETLEQLIASDGKPGVLVLCQRFRGAGDPWSGEFETSLSASRRLIDHLADRFDEPSPRSIVLISSLAGEYVAEEQPLSYHVAKGAMNQLVRHYAVALGKKGIRVNAVAPGKVVKEETREHVLKDADLCDAYRALTPLGRLGTPEDIAGVVLFLCSPGSAFMTGQILRVDGGLSLLGHESLVRQVAERWRPRRDPPGPRA